MTAPTPTAERLAVVTWAGQGEPIVLTLYFVLRGVRARNTLLLAASILFYAWGETGYLAILLASIAANWGFGLWIERTRQRPGLRPALALAIGANLLLLGAFVLRCAGLIDGVVVNIDHVIEHPHRDPFRCKAAQAALGVLTKSVQ